MPKNTSLDAQLGVTKMRSTLMQQTHKRPGEQANRQRRNARRNASVDPARPYLVGDDHKRLCVRLELAHEWVEPRNKIQVRLPPRVAVPQLHTT